MQIQFLQTCLLGPDFPKSVFRFQICIEVAIFSNLENDNIEFLCWQFFCLHFWYREFLDSLQLKITYSRHKDLNVKGNNDKSMDYTGGLLGTPGPQTSGGLGAPNNNVIPASAYHGPGQDLLMGGYGGAIGMTETSPSGFPTSSHTLSNSSIPFAWLTMTCTALKIQFTPNVL